MVNFGVEPNVHTYGALIDGCAKAGQVAKAFGAYGIMRSKVCSYFQLSPSVSCFYCTHRVDLYMHAVECKTRPNCIQCAY